MKKEILITCYFIPRPSDMVMFSEHILGKAIIVSSDPIVNKTILQNHGNAFIPCYPKSITELLGKSLILQINGSLHKKVHALIGVFLKSPQFKARITRDIERAVQHCLRSWSDKTDLILQNETKKITFEILVRVLLSIEPGEEMNLLKREFEEFIKGLICLPINLPGTTLYNSLKAKKRLLEMVNKFIEKRKISLEKTEGNEKPPVDVIDALLRDLGESELNHVRKSANKMSKRTQKVAEARAAADGKPSAGALYRCIYAKDGLMEMPQDLHSP